MDRDLELTRQILQAVRNYGSPDGLQGIPEFDNYDNKVISYHIKILSEAGFITAVPISEVGKEYNDYFSINLTWAGHDFIDAAKNDTVWYKAKEIIIKAGGSFTFDILIEILKAKTKEKIGIP